LFTLPVTFIVTPEPIVSVGAGLPEPLKAMLPEMLSVLVPPKVTAALFDKVKSPLQVNVPCMELDEVLLKVALPTVTEAPLCIVTVAELLTAKAPEKVTTAGLLITKFPPESANAEYEASAVIVVVPEVIVSV